MGVEMKLQDVLIEATIVFQGRITKTIDDMKGKTGTFIKGVQD
jgi:hypothetical protein